MSSEEGITRAVRTLSEKIGAGGLNLLVNNAAILKPSLSARLCDTSRQDVMDVYETNVAGPFLLTKVNEAAQGEHEQAEGVPGWSPEEAHRLIRAWNSSQGWEVADWMSSSVPRCSFLSCREQLPRLIGVNLDT